MSNWTQIGADISGISGEHFGSSVALSANGTILAVGAYNNDGDTNNKNDNRGAVRVFEWDGTSWNQLGNSIYGTTTAEQSGWSVALSSNGHILAIGSYKYNQSRGQTRVYSWDGLAWNQLGSSINGEALGEQSSVSISLSSSGNTVAIGSNRASTANGIDSGRTRIYDLSGTSWIQRGNSILGKAANNFSGGSVSLSSNSNIVAIGANAADNVGLTDAGSVCVYIWNEITGEWTQQGTDIFGLYADERSGQSVSLSADGSVVLVGALLNSVAAANAGAMRVFEWNGSIWNQKGSDILGTRLNDGFGRTVKLSSDGSIVAGSSFSNNGLNNDLSQSGQVRILKWSENNWNVLGSQIYGTIANETNGYSFALSSDGSIVATSSPNLNVPALQTGRVRVFSYPLTVPCLPAGTRVLTATGYKAVETLCQDDLIVTSEGQAVPFKVYTTDIAITTEKNAAYLVPAHTFGKYPVKDLVLSPNHAFQSRPGVWQIPKYAAMMNPTIKQVDVGKPVTYYHIETPDYFKDNLMVEGTPVESFAHKQLRKGEIVYSYSVRYNGFIRSQAARQMQGRLTK